MHTTDLVWKPVGKQQLGSPRNWQDNIQAYLTEKDCEWTGSQLWPVVDCGTLGFYHTKDS
jgi:hypothetical protein